MAKIINPGESFLKMPKGPTLEKGTDAPFIKSDKSKKNKPLYAKLEARRIRRIEQESKGFSVINQIRIKDNPNLEFNIRESKALRAAKSISSSMASKPAINPSPINEPAYVAELMGRTSFIGIDLETSGFLSQQLVDGTLHQGVILQAGTLKAQGLGSYADPKNRRISELMVSPRGQGVEINAAHIAAFKEGAYNVNKIETLFQSNPTGLISAANLRKHLETLVSGNSEKILFTYGGTGFDLPMLSHRLGFGTGILKNVHHFDVLDMARRVLPGISHKQVDVAKYLGIESSGAHAAGADIEMTSHILEKLAPWDPVFHGLMAKIYKLEDPERLATHAEYVSSLEARRADAAAGELRDAQEREKKISIDKSSIMASASSPSTFHEDMENLSNEPGVGIPKKSYLETGVGLPDTKDPELTQERAEKIGYSEKNAGTGPIEGFGVTGHGGGGYSVTGEALMSPLAGEDEGIAYTGSMAQRKAAEVLANREIQDKVREDELALDLGAHSDEVLRMEIDRSKFYTQISPMNYSMDFLTGPIRLSVRQAEFIRAGRGSKWAGVRAAIAARAAEHDIVGRTQMTEFHGKIGALQARNASFAYNLEPNAAYLGYLEGSGKVAQIVEGQQLAYSDLVFGRSHVMRVAGSGVVVPPHLLIGAKIRVSASIVDQEFAKKYADPETFLREMEVSLPRARELAEREARGEISHTPYVNPESGLERVSRLGTAEEQEEAESFDYLESEVKEETEGEKTDRLLSNKDTLLKSDYVAPNESLGNELRPREIANTDEISMADKILGSTYQSEIEEGPEGYTEIGGTPTGKEVGLTHYQKRLKKLESTIKRARIYEHVPRKNNFGEIIKNKRGTVQYTEKMVFVRYSKKFIDAYTRAMSKNVRSYVKLGRNPSDWEYQIGPEASRMGVGTDIAESDKYTSLQLVLKGKGKIKSMNIPIYLDPIKNFGDLYLIGEGGKSSIAYNKLLNPVPAQALAERVFGVYFKKIEGREAYGAHTAAGTFLGEVSPVMIRDEMGNLKPSWENIPVSGKGYAKIFEHNFNYNVAFAGTPTPFEWNRFGKVEHEVNKEAWKKNLAIETQNSYDNIKRMKEGEPVESAALRDVPSEISSITQVRDANTLRYDPELQGTLRKLYLQSHGDYSLISKFKMHSPGKYISSTGEFIGQKLYDEYMEGIASQYRSKIKHITPLIEGPTGEKASGMFKSKNVIITAMAVSAALLTLGASSNAQISSPDDMSRQAYASPNVDQRMYGGKMPYQNTARVTPEYNGMMGYNTNIDINTTDRNNVNPAELAYVMDRHARNAMGTTSRGNSVEINDNSSKEDEYRRKNKYSNMIG